MVREDLRFTATPRPRLSCNLLLRGENLAVHIIATGVTCGSIRRLGAPIAVFEKFRMITFVFLIFVVTFVEPHSIETVWVRVGSVIRVTILDILQTEQSIRFPRRSIFFPIGVPWYLEIRSGYRFNEYLEDPVVVVDVTYADLHRVVPASIHISTSGPERDRQADLLDRTFGRNFRPDTSPIAVDIHTTRIFLQRPEGSVRSHGARTVAKDLPVGRYPVVPGDFVERVRSIGDEVVPVVVNFQNYTVDGSFGGSDVAFGDQFYEYVSGVCLVGSSVTGHIVTLVHR